MTILKATALLTAAENWLEPKIKQLLLLSLSKSNALHFGTNDVDFETQCNAMRYWDVSSRLYTFIYCPDFFLDFILSLEGIFTVV